MKVYELQATEEDVDRFYEYIIKHLDESGKDGMPVFAPGGSSSLKKHFSKEEKIKALQKSVNEPQWQRCFMLLDEESNFIGHCRIKNTWPMPFANHRCDIGIGILREHIGKGLGTQFLQFCIDWAREQGFAWMDLGVFSENTPAVKLYEKLGFTKTGFTEDLFRLDGLSVDEYQMSLKL